MGNLKNTLAIVYVTFLIIVAMWIVKNYFSMCYPNKLHKNSQQSTNNFVISAHPIQNETNLETSKFNRIKNNKVGVVPEESCSKNELESQGSESKVKDKTIQHHQETKIPDKVYQINQSREKKDFKYKLIENNTKEKNFSTKTIKASASKNNISIIQEVESQLEIGYSSSFILSVKNTKQQPHYVIQIDAFPPFTHIVFQENEIYYGQFKNSQFLQKNGHGYHYKVTYDAQTNPQFEIYSGNYLDNRREGEGILYEGKSTNILYRGLWNKYAEQLKNQQNNNDIIITIDPPKHKKIVIMEQGKIINDKPNKTRSQVHETWVTYNQQINHNDLNILTDATGWFTSSIIDAFSLYLNIKGEQHLLSINSLEEQKIYERVLVLPSDLYTSMHENQDEQNRQIFQKHLLEYLPIKYRIDIVFKKVLFVINNNNMHWLLAKVDYSSKTLVILDSIKKSEYFYYKIIKILKGVLQLELDILVGNPFQQNNGYDCGPCTCLNMLNETKLNINLENKNPSGIRHFLFHLLRKS